MICRPTPRKSTDSSSETESAHSSDTELGTLLEQHEFGDNASMDSRWEDTFVNQDPAMKPYRNLKLEPVPR